MQVRKTEAEIVAMHKKTIEIYTGKVCHITLINREEYYLKGTPLQQILFIIEQYNHSSYAVVSEEREAVKFRKLFCVVAANAGHSANKISAYLGKKDHTNALYHIRTGSELLEKDEQFKNLYHTVIRKIISEKTSRE